MTEYDEDADVYFLHTCALCGYDFPPNEIEDVCPGCDVDYERDFAFTGIFCRGADSPDALPSQVTITLDQAELQYLVNMVNAGVQSDGTVEDIAVAHLIFNKIVMQTDLIGIPIDMILYSIGKSSSEWDAMTELDKINLLEEMGYREVDDDDPFMIRLPRYRYNRLED